MLPINLTTVIALLSLKGAMRATVIGGIAVLALALFTMIASALCELAGNIGHLWSTSDSVTRLLMLILAVYIVRKATPYIVLLHAKGLL